MLKTKQNKEADVAVLNLFKALRRLVKGETKKLSKANYKKLTSVVRLMNTKPTENNLEVVKQSFLKSIKGDPDYIGCNETYYLIETYTPKESLDSIVKELLNICGSKDFKASVLLLWSQTMRDKALEEKRKLTK
ncbi:hypothetical protein IPF86_02060 [Candidatus Nomurabacteria bacterium]|jgi:hypothetical protein|nr:MAG: hypothetical protein IPF86_02060 [Candidatus Nomurabacteria bacterium]